MPQADTLFLGSVLTMDYLRPRAAAVAVRGGKVLAVGDAAELHPLTGPDTNVVHVGGGCLLPGFHDAHVHLVSLGMELRQVDLTNAATLDDALAAVREGAQAARPGAWVHGAGFALQRWGLATLGRTEADALERAAGGLPVRLVSQDHHSAWVSREALRRAGIDAATPDPEHGVIVRDEEGQPTGLLLERAVGLLDGAMPEETRADREGAVRAAAEHFASLGITSVHHMAFDDAGRFRAMATAASDDGYPVRVWACLPHQDIERAAALGIATGHGGDTFRIGGAKFFADGALGSRTAWMLEPYGGDHGEAARYGVGIAVDGPEVLAERVPLAIEAGLAPVVHAIGDRAVRAVLDVFEATAERWRAAGLRPRVEHAQHVHPDDVARFGRLGLVASMQPTHITFDVESVHDLLEDRVDRAYPMRSLARAGAHLAFGSDTPVAPADVFVGLRAASRRASRSGTRLGPAESISPDAALAAYTTGAAFAIGAEGRSGALREGYDADLTIVSHDPTVTLDGLEVLATVKGGRFTYRAPDFEG